MKGEGFDVIIKNLLEKKKPVKTGFFLFSATKVMQGK